MPHSLDINQLGGSEGCPREILKLISSEIAANVYFSIYFYILKIFKEGNKLHERGTLSESLKMGDRAPVPPAPTSIAIGVFWRAVAASLVLSS